MATESLDEQALRIVRSLPIAQSFVDRIRRELAAGYSEDVIVQCVMAGTWPSTVASRWGRP